MRVKCRSDGVSVPVKSCSGVKDVPVISPTGARCGLTNGDRVPTADVGAPGALVHDGPHEGAGGEVGGGVGRCRCGRLDGRQRLSGQHGFIAFELVGLQQPHVGRNDVAGLENPTSEILAKWIWDKMKPSLPEIVRITVFETCEVRCEYEGDDE